MADLMALYEIPPPPPIQRVHMLFLQQFNFYHFVVFKDGEPYNVLWITPPPLIRDLGMSTCSFCRLILHQFSSFSWFPRWRILWRYMKYPPPSPHPVNLTCFFAAIWFLSFCRFQRWRTLQRHMNYPFPSNQRSGYVYLFFLPIDFASIFIVFSFSKMADIRRHMKYPWLESTLSTFWPLKYTPTPLSVFFIWFDVIRMPRKADSHAPHVWLAWLARLTRLPRMPRWLVPYTNSCNFTNEGQKSLQRIVLQTANIRS